MWSFGFFLCRGYGRLLLLLYGRHDVLFFGFLLKIREVVVFIVHAVIWIVWCVVLFGGFIVSLTTSPLKMFAM